jgi:hypothetical protein
MEPCVAAKRTLMAAERILKLEAALERIRDCDWVITLPDRMDAVRQIAREALAKDTELNTKLNTNKTHV